jgi:uncharacterized membrane protein
MTAPAASSAPPARRLVDLRLTEPMTLSGIPRSTPARTIARWLLGGAMVFAGTSHLFWARREFQAQVPDWTGKVIDKDGVVVASGVVEIMLGAALVALPRERSRVGAVLAAFFVAIFPGNVEQYTKGKKGFGLDEDRMRLTRLFFQPVLVAVAIWSTRTPRA